MNAHSKNQPTKQTVRLSVSVPSIDYSMIERIASNHKVSVAWVIRDAIDKYLTSKADAANCLSATNPKK